MGYGRRQGHKENYVLHLSRRCEGNRIPHMGLRQSTQGGRQVALPARHEEDEAHQRQVVEDRLLYGQRLHLQRHEHA